MGPGEETTCKGVAEPTEASFSRPPTTGVRSPCLFYYYYFILLNITMLMLLIHACTPCVDYSPYQSNVFSNVIMFIIRLVLVRETSRKKVLTDFFYRLSRGEPDPSRVGVG